MISPIRCSAVVLTSAALLSLPTQKAVAQAGAFEKYKFEALQFSQLQPSGTSRTQAMGGAGVALGADLGSFLLNPANLGSYRRSEFSISPGLLLNSQDTNAGLFGRPLNTATSDGRNNFNIANLGVAIATTNDNAGSDWRGGAVGINFSRLATFSNRRTYALTGLDSSRSVNEFLLQDFFLPNKGNGDANELFNNFDDNIISTFADLAYRTYLIDFPTDSTYSTPLWHQSRARQSETTTVRGAVNQIDIGYGGSYRDKFYLGGSLGIVTMRYEQTRELTETLDVPTTGRASDISSISLRDSYETQGAGINLRIGAVYRPADFVRLGASVQTPTFASELKETVEPTTLTVNYRRPFGADLQTSYTSSIPASEFQYSLTTPFRAMGGLTLIFKPKSETMTNEAGEQMIRQGSAVAGLLSADIEYVNYGRARLSAIDNDPAQADFSAANAAIRREYASAVNYRVGGELRLGQVYVRGGYATYANPFKDQLRGSERQVVATGFGLRRANSYIDFGISRTTLTADLYSPYQLKKYDPNDVRADAAGYVEEPYEPVVSSKITIVNPTVTVGFVIQ